MKVGFIGAGKMAEALIGALLSAKVVDPHQIFASDIDAARRNAIKKRLGINTYLKNQMITANCDVIVLAVKPQILKTVLNEIKTDINDKQLIISIAAGIKLHVLESIINTGRVIRVMPNLPCVVQEGMSVFCVGSKAIKKDKQIVTDIFSSCGKVVQMDESLFDAVTALSGSGPAFFAHFAQQMINVATELGLDEKDAILLTQQTMLGTSKLMIENKLSPNTLIELVKSPKGTTEAGLKVIQKKAFSSIVANTIKAAADRSKELNS